MVEDNVHITRMAIMIPRARKPYDSLALRHALHWNGRVLKYPALHLVHPIPSYPSLQLP
jgi:hypothetical protein